MERNAFFYDVSAADWQECRDDGISFTEMEQVPVHFVVNRPKFLGGSRTNMIWCPRHKTYEEVAAQERHTLATTEGCEFNGLFGYVDFDDEERPFNCDILIRSRSLYNERANNVTIFADIARINCPDTRDTVTGERTHIPRTRQYKVESLSVMLTDGKISPQDKLQKLPLSAAKLALPMLKKAVEKKSHDVKLPSSIKGDVFPSTESLLSSFLYCPYDMNLGLLREYLKGLPDLREMSSENIFLNLCQFFHLEADEELRQIYDNNPLALPILFVLGVLGVKDKELSKPFLKFNSFLVDSVAAGMKNIIGYSSITNLTTGFPADFYEETEKLQGFLEQRATNYETWHPLLFYCHYLLRRRGEQALAKELLKLNENWQSRLWNSLRLFFHHFPEFTQDFKDRVVLEGLTLDVHNAMVRIINQKKLAWPEFTYSEKEKGYECEIGGYEFHLINNSETYYSLMRELGIGNVVQSTLPDSGILRVAVLKDGKGVACLELHSIAVMKHPSRNPIYDYCLREASLRIAYLHWLKWTGLWENYGPYYEEDYEILQEDVKANPLPKDAGISLYELLNAKETGKGYYLRLYHAFVTAKALCFEVAPPKDYDKTSEMDYLMALFPYGKPIYNAAFAGNAEAKLALSRCYHDGGKYHTLFPVDEKRSAYWRNN